MCNNTVLHEETCIEITKLLADKIINVEEQNKEKIKRIYFNWLEFANSLKEEV